MNPRKFIEIWQTSKSVDEVRKKTGVSKPTLYKRAQYYRKKGVPLKKFLDRKPNDWKELILFADGLQAGNMNCPKCNEWDTRIIERRNNEEVTRRRRECFACKHRFTTYEAIKEPKIKETPLKTLPKKINEIDKNKPRKPKTKGEKKRIEYFGKFGKTKVTI